MTSAAERLSSAIDDRYKIERELGEGGMATVYLAEDIRHRRKVAIKVLQPELSAALGPERFLKEIELTAQLQHPNILPLFDSGVADGLLYYVMPYVDGESLRERLNREHQLSIADAVRIATDVAGALEYAHKRGVIHRDIKPENILLQDGRPIVADFGIALAVSAAGGNRVTQTGMSLGTPQYMSPEQATGDRQIDARSDIYSLGAVTYEMLTGDPPHTGSTGQAVIAKVITEKPTPIHTIRSTVPPQVEFAVDRALAKVPADRWASAREFTDAIEGRLALTKEFPLAKQRQTWIPWIVSAAAIAALVLVGVTKKSEGTGPLVRFTIESVGDEHAQIEDAAISRDGQTIVIATRTGDSTELWLKRIDEVAPHRLSGSDGAQSPFFSPDGKYVGFLGTDGNVRKIPVDGGAATVIGRMSNPVGVTWITPDTIVAGMIAFSNVRGLSLLSADNSEIGELTKAPADQMHHFPIATPDGRAILFSLVHLGATASGTKEIAGSQRADLGLTSLTGKFDTIQATTPIQVPLGFVGDRLIYQTNRRLWSIPVDLERHKLSGRPTDLGEDAGDDGAAHLASNGTLIYTGSDFAGAGLLVRPGRSPDTLVIDRVAGLIFPRWSPDGRSIAFTAVGDEPGLYVLDRGTRTMTRFMTFRSPVIPEWSPDGTRIMSAKYDSGYVSWLSRDGSSAPEKIVSAPPGGTILSCAIAPDGKTVAMTVIVAASTAIYISKVGGQPRDARLYASDAGWPQWSGDGKWIAYQSIANRKRRIVAQSYPGGGIVQVSEDDGTHPIWPRGSSEIYYELAQNIMSATVDQTRGGLRVSGRRTVWRGKATSERAEAPFTNFDVARAGDMIVLETINTGHSKVVVEVNWADHIRRPPQQK